MQMVNDLRVQFKSWPPVTQHGYFFSMIKHQQVMKIEQFVLFLLVFRLETRLGTIINWFSCHILYLSKRDF